MDQREQVRRAYVIEGKNIRSIAREGLHDRRTVGKFIRDAGPPKYTMKVPRRRPMLWSLCCPLLQVAERG